MRRDRIINMTGSNYKQHGNYGVGHLEGGEIKDNAKVAGHLEENNHNSSNNTDVNLTVNIDSQNKSKVEENTLNNNLTSGTSKFEITLSGELTKDQRASYKGIEIEIEDLVEKLSELGIKHKLTIKYVKQGSIKIGLEGHPEDFQKLQELFQSGQLDEILGIPVENISLIANKNLEDDEEIGHKEQAHSVNEKTNRNFPSKYHVGFSDVVKTLVPNSLKTNFRIICIQEGKTISKMIEELLDDLIQSNTNIPRDLNLPLDNHVVVKAYVPKELKRQFKIFCMEQKVPMNLALQYIIKRRVEVNNNQINNDN